MLGKKFPGKMSYSEYLKSSRWAAIRETVLTSRSKCYVCQSRKGLLPHHISYRHLGYEKLGCDVVVVCFDCHKKIHWWFFKLFKVPIKTHWLLFSMNVRAFTYSMGRGDVLRALLCLFRAVIVW